MKVKTMDRVTALIQMGFGTGERPTPDELKRRYRQLVKTWHPDNNKSPDAATEFDKVTQAYQLLCELVAASYDAGTQDEDRDGGGRQGSGTGAGRRPRTGRRAGPFAAPAVPIVTPERVDFGVVVPGTWAEPIYVEVYAHRPSDQSDDRIPRTVNLGATQGDFWLCTDLEPDPDVDRPHLLLSFEANIPRDSAGGTLEDEYRISYGKHTVTIPITIRVMRPPSIDLSLRKTGMRVDLASDEKSLQGADVTVDWGDGTTNTAFTHTYVRGGSYTVTVTAENAAGNATRTDRVTVVDAEAVARFEQRHRAYQALRSRAASRAGFRTLIVLGVLALIYRSSTLARPSYAFKLLMDMVREPQRYPPLVLAEFALTTVLIVAAVVAVITRPLVGIRRRRRVVTCRADLQRQLSELGTFDIPLVTINDGPPAKLTHSSSALLKTGRVLFAIPCGAIAGAVGFVITWCVFYLGVAIYAALAGDSLDSDAYNHHFFPISFGVLAGLWGLGAITTAIGLALSD